jgi:hypothetical protein
MAAGYPVKANYANGDVLTATNLNDLSGTVNFAVNATPTTATQMAGKNAIINGDFGIWQRGTSFTLNGSGVNNFTADRWNAQFDGTGATCTVSQQTFTAGTAPISGYEGTFFARWNRSAAGTSNTLNYYKQTIEDVRAFAGQAITVSFWAKADAARTLSVQMYQEFGSGGSGAVLALTGSASLTTSWARYTITATVPSIASKTIGTGSSLTLYFIQPTATAFTIDYWGVQVESGSSATPFQTATGTKQGELAACQRYYWRTSATGLYSPMGQGSANGTTGGYVTIQNPVQMRAVTSVEYSNLGLQEGGDALKAVTSVTIDQSDLAVVSLAVGASGGGLTTYRANRLLANNNSSAYLAISGEL